MDSDEQVRDADQPEKVVPARIAERQAKRSSSGWKIRKPSKRMLIISVIVVILAAAGGWFGFRFIAYAGIDTVRYQAVYLDNDNVYFGKVEFLLNGNVILNDVYRVQAADGGTGTDKDANAQAAADIRLIKPGNELHAPDDKMLISREKILFIENLKTDGKVTNAINEYQKQKK